MSLLPENFFTKVLSRLCFTGKVMALHEAARNSHLPVNTTQHSLSLLSPPAFYIYSCSATRACNLAPDTLRSTSPTQLSLTRTFIHNIFQPPSTTLPHHSSTASYIHHHRDAPSARPSPRIIQIVCNTRKAPLYIDRNKMNFQHQLFPSPSSNTRILDQDDDAQICGTDATSAQDVAAQSQEDVWNTYAREFVTGRSEHHNTCTSTESLLDGAAVEFEPGFLGHCAWSSLTHPDLNGSAPVEMLNEYGPELTSDSYPFTHTEPQGWEMMGEEYEANYATFTWPYTLMPADDNSLSENLTEGLAYEQEQASQPWTNVFATLFVPGCEEHTLSYTLNQDSPSPLPSNVDTIQVSPSAPNPLARDFVPGEELWCPYSFIAQDTDLESNSEGREGAESRLGFYDPISGQTDEDEDTIFPLASPSENGAIGGNDDQSQTTDTKERNGCSAEYRYALRQAWILTDHDDATDYGNYMPEELMEDHCVHHISFLGRPVMHKSCTPPAVSIAVLNCTPKNLSITRPYDLRKGAIMSCAMDLIDPVVYYGDREILEKFHGTALEDQCIGMCEKFYSGYGWWQMDTWDQEEHIPTVDTLDPEAYHEDATVINGVTSGFPSRTDILTASTEEKVKEDTARKEAVKARIARGPVKSRLGMACVSAEDLEEIPMFNAVQKPIGRISKCTIPLEIMLDTPVHTAPSSGSRTTSQSLEAAMANSENLLPELLDWADESEELADETLQVRVVRISREGSACEVEVVRPSGVEAEGIPQQLEDLRVKAEEHIEQVATEVVEIQPSDAAKGEQTVPEEQRRVSDSSAETKENASRSSSLSEAKESPRTSAEPSDNEDDIAEVKALQPNNDNQGSDDASNSSEQSVVADGQDDATTLTDRIPVNDGGIMDALAQVEATIELFRIPSSLASSPPSPSSPVPHRSPLRIVKRDRQTQPSFTEAELQASPEPRVTASEELTLRPFAPESQPEQHAFRHVDGQEPRERRFPNGAVTMALPGQRFGLVRSPEMGFGRQHRAVVAPVAKSPLAIIPEDEDSFVFEEQNDAEVVDNKNVVTASDEWDIEGTLISPNVTIREQAANEGIPRRIIVADISPEENNDATPPTPIALEPSPKTSSTSTGESSAEPSSLARPSRHVRFAVPVETVRWAPRPLPHLQREPISPAMRSLMRILREYETYESPSPCDPFHDFSGVHRSSPEITSFPPFGSFPSSPTSSEDDEHLSPVPELPVFQSVKRRLFTPPGSSTRRRLTTRTGSWNFLSGGVGSLRRKGKAPNTVASASIKPALVSSTNRLSNMDNPTRSEGWFKKGLRKVKDAFISKNAA